MALLGYVPCSKPFFFAQRHTKLSVQLERALCLIKDNIINIEDVLAASLAQCKLMVKTPKAFNKATGKETWTAHAFSENNWGSATHSFSKPARQTWKMIMRDITSMSWKLLKKPKSGLEDFISDDNQLQGT
jgi:hypothetical protein